MKKSAPIQLDGKVMLEMAVQDVEAGLNLMPGDQADFIIGQKGYGDDAALSRAAQAQFQLLYTVLQEDSRNTDSLKSKLAKTLTVVLQLVHVAYAAGIRRGRRESKQRRGGKR